MTKTTTRTTNGARPSVAAQDLTAKQPIHAYLTPDAHDTWHEVCARQRVSVSAMIEALAPALADIIDALPDIVTEAGRIETTRRRRNRRASR